MNLQQTAGQARVSHQRSGEADTQLQGRWLILGRMLWIAIFILTLVVFCANLLVGNYGMATTILLIATTSVWFAVALVLFWRKSSDWFILLFSLVLVLTGGFFFPPLPLALLHNGIWWLPVDVLVVLGTVMLSFVYAFPDGRFVPSFTRWLALGWIAVSLVPYPILGTVYHWNWWLSPLYTLVRITFYGSLVLAMLYRYRRKATAVQRQQIKWVVFAGTIVVGAVSVVNLGLNVLPSYFPMLGVSPQLHQLASALALYLLSILAPLSIGFAMLRNRLWDIDIVINRTLVYGLLTVILAGSYVGLVIGLQVLLRGIISQDNNVAIVISTLIIVALFEPLRSRIQQFIDRRFYRSKYDAAKVVAAFSSTLRDDVDLATLSEHLVAVVQETMQPTQVSLWLCPPTHNEKYRAPWRATPPGSSEGR